MPQNHTQPVPDWSAPRARRDARQVSATATALLHVRTEEQIAFEERQRDLRRYEATLRDRKAPVPSTRVREMRESESQAHGRLSQQLRNAWTTTRTERREAQRREAETHAELLLLGIEQLDCAPRTVTFGAGAVQRTASSVGDYTSSTSAPGTPTHRDRDASRKAASTRALDSRLCHIRRLHRGELGRAGAARSTAEFDLQSSRGSNLAKDESPTSARAFGASPTLASFQREGAVAETRWERGGPTFCHRTAGPILGDGDDTETFLRVPMLLSLALAPPISADAGTVEAFVDTRGEARRLKDWVFRGNGVIY